jgi:hypothetical protein
MTQDYQGPQAPPPPRLTDETVKEWWNEALKEGGRLTVAKVRHFANRAAAWTWEQAMATLAEREQAAADAQLEWCYEWLGGDRDTTGLALELRGTARAARRPKPPTLAEKGLSVLDACGDNIGPANEQELRAALLRLQELEQATTTTTETIHD